MAVSTRFDLIERDLQTLRSGGREQSRRRQRTILVSLVRRLSLVDPLDVFERGARVSEHRAYWARPADRFAMAAVGSTWTLTADRDRPFLEVGRAWADACSDSLMDAGEPADGVGPLLLGGFAFDPTRPRTSLWEGFPPGRLVLPRYLVTTLGETSWLTINQMVRAEESADHDRSPGELADLLAGTPDPGATFGGAPSSAPVLSMEDLVTADEWQAMVASLVERLRLGEPRKVVLARASRVRGPAAWHPERVLRSLRTAFPACTTFAVALGGRCFLGASPEQLVRLREGVVDTMALAGSIGRGATPDEDRRMREHLFQSPKDRAEHAIVVGTIRDGLAGLSSEVIAPHEPTVLTLSNVHHLFTPIRGRVAPGRTILDLVERLHPTPSVGGDPRDAALTLIRDRERLDRGWYAGPVGWIDRAGDGEFVVGIRSALLSGNEATLFSGCGIVAASDPVREYAESCWKLRPVLAALEASVA